MLDMAERLEGMLEELTDMAMDALRPRHVGRPRLAETGEALALERRILKARRALETVRRRAARGLRARRASRSTTAPDRRAAGAPVRRRLA